MCLLHGRSPCDQFYFISWRWHHQFSEYGRLQGVSRGRCLASLAGQWADLCSERRMTLGRCSAIGSAATCGGRTGCHASTDDTPCTHSYIVQVLGKPAPCKVHQPTQHVWGLSSRAQLCLQSVGVAACQQCVSFLSWGLREHTESELMLCRPRGMLQNLVTRCNPSHPSLYP